MLRRRLSRYAPLLITVVLVGLLVVLSMLEYRWIWQLSEMHRHRMQASREKKQRWIARAATPTKTLTTRYSVQTVWPAMEPLPGTSRSFVIRRQRPRIVRSAIRLRPAIT